ncbi:Lrp/AsnC family transcriptional regulator [Eremococcus coleocola]|uniref:Transcriptional regulator, AsnC family n=1 Tax=Eremococcus coleocola ACS-139-V-Col8 TaxID=908337 RepID=E4KRE5_9LACT|nr:Lrp/AsnC family transcriptional regulator [Eremococcus coleocola]EFR30492.1 transcriptional regulator, AsnC family [Eremococcus coleocola ACS-139-V-Col8]
MENREELLKLIETDSRLSIAELSRMLDMDQAAVEAEIAALEEENIIVGYHTLVNWDKTDDDHVEAIIEVKVNPQRGKGFDSIAAKIYQFEEVQALYLMSGGYDFNVELKKAPMKEIARFVSNKLSIIEEVQSTTTHVILKKYKDHGTFFVEKGKDKRMAVQE